MIINDDEEDADLDFDGDVLMYKGRPFVGIVREHHRNRKLKSESYYWDGFPEGVCKEWYDDGRLKREWHRVRGAAHGKMCVWHKNGKLKSVAQYWRGTELSFDEWDEDGALTTHRVIDWESPLGQYALKLGAKKP